MTLAESLADMLDDLLIDGGVDVQYVRPGYPAEAIRAIKGRSGSIVVGATDHTYGTRIDDDFVVKVADWPTSLGDEPLSGDEITWTDSLGTIHQHVVVVADGTERCYDPVGQFGLAWRIHTVLM